MIFKRLLVIPSTDFDLHYGRMCSVLLNYPGLSLGEESERFVAPSGDLFVALPFYGGHFDSALHELSEDVIYENCQEQTIFWQKLEEKMPHPVVPFFVQGHFAGEISSAPGSGISFVLLAGVF